MSRVININSPGKRRNHARRSIAEILRLLVTKAEIDTEARDMAATLVYQQRIIQATVEESATAWEKRGYWLKSERFIRDWDWIPESAANFEDVIRNDAWDLLPDLLIGLSSHFTDIQIKKMTRKPSEWQGAYERLLADPPTELPY